MYFAIGELNVDAFKQVNYAQNLSGNFCLYSYPFTSPIMLEGASSSIPFVIFHLLKG